LKIIEVEVKRYLDTKGSDMAVVGSHELIIVQVHTDQEITGTGFLSTPISSHGMIGDLAAAFLRRNLRSVVLGENPLYTEQVWQKMYGIVHRLGRRGLFRSCMAALDFALWDIKGKKMNVPVSDLLGSRRKRIPTYANVGHQLPPDQMAEKTLEYVKKGHTAVKIRGGTSAVSLKESTRRVAAVREAIGPDIKLMVDANGSWDADTAIQQLKEWEAYNLYWLEEPVPPEDLTGYVRVKQNAGSVYIAGGEQNAGIHDFRHFIEQGALDIAQPNASATGGITDWLRIYHLVSAYNIPISPWNLQQIHIHMAAGLPHVKWIEYFTPDRKFFQNQLFKGPQLQEVRDQDGVFLIPPDSPGLGLELNEEVAEQTLVKE